MSNTKKADSGTAQGARRATEQASESGPLLGAGRWSAKRKVSIILELLRGADRTTQEETAMGRAKNPGSGRATAFGVDRQVWTG